MKFLKLHTPLGTCLFCSEEVAEQGVFGKTHLCAAASVRGPASGTCLLAQLL